MFRVLCCLALGLLLCSTGAVAGDWPHLRGPESDGRVSAPGTFGDGDVGLSVAWTVPIGSSYSGVAVADGRAVTLFADDSSDWVAAYEAGTGKLLWRQRLGEVYKGIDGADDGPLSSPVISGKRVFALDPRGRLVALKLADGEVAWEKQVVEELGGQKPSFGFTSSPLIVSGVLVVQVGGTEGRSIVGLDPADGKVLWSHGDEAVHYQSPTAMTLGGMLQVVAVSEGKIRGFAPRDGRVLWTHELGEDDRPRSATPTFIGEDRFIILVGSGATVYRVSGAGSGFRVEEAYRTESVGRTYAQPVFHEGHVYGFRGQVLTCMNADTGERVWRSRPPGGEGLVLVDGHLAIFGAKGLVVIVDASPEGYREVAQIQALEGSGLTWPSFADGKIFVRNLETLAAVAITRGGGKLSSQLDDAGAHEFGAWLRRLRAADEPGPMIDAYLTAHPRSPIVEGPFLHFLYRGDASDVSIAGSMNNSEAIEQMARVEGTDLFYRTYRLEPGSRWQYRYQVDFETWTVDPRNPRQTPGVEGDDPYSEVLTPGYRLAPYMEHSEEPSGTIETFTLTSEILGYDKEIRVWLPPGYADSNETYPLVVVNDGDAWIDRGKMPHTLDGVVGSSVAPVIVAFVPAVRAWWTEGGGSRTAEFVVMQVEELLPALESRYRLTHGASYRAVVGNRFFAASAIHAALRYPEVFGKVGLQSLYLGLGSEQELNRLIGEGAGKSTRIYFDWNRYDERNIDRGYDISKKSREFAAMLLGAGYSVRGGEYLDSYGWNAWRNRTGEMLESMFPLGGN